jgi:hypothetical protein
VATASVTVTDSRVSELVAGAVGSRPWPSWLKSPASWGSVGPGTLSVGEPRVALSRARHNKLTLISVLTVSLPVSFAVGADRSEARLNG